jgi:FkbM family methyltransferase
MSFAGRLSRQISRAPPTMSCRNEVGPVEREAAKEMAFTQAKRILGADLPVGSKWKLLLMQASTSRPQTRCLCMSLLRPYIRNREVSVAYKCSGRPYTALVRIGHLSSDLFTFGELAVRSVYRLNTSFVPDVIVDAGGNIGLFSLRAAAAYPSAKIVICEPVPQCVEQIRKNLLLNGVSAEVLSVCLGGGERRIPFYVREAVGSSFNPEKPYTTQIDVEVIRLQDILGVRRGRQILVKLDIEGMELEVLESYVPFEKRPVRIVGELHDHAANSRRLEQIFVSNGWNMSFGELSGRDSLFEASSPAATMLMTNNEHAASS